MELIPVTAQTEQEACGLRVFPEQEPFVASNAESLLDARDAVRQGVTARPFLLYHRDQAVGFVLLSYGAPDAPSSVGVSSYCIWRLMIDCRFQGRGLGRLAMEAILTYLRQLPQGPGEYVWLSYEPENETARALYHSFGFRETGEQDGTETVAALLL